ncbi:hypothetical protein LPJ61_003398, partial [Coemansia biformis]
RSPSISQTHACTSSMARAAHTTRMPAVEPAPALSSVSCAWLMARTPRQRWLWRSALTVWPAATSGPKRSARSAASTAIPCRSSCRQRVSTRAPPPARPRPCAGRDRLDPHYRAPTGRCRRPRCRHACPRRSPCRPRARIVGLILRSRRTTSRLLLETRRWKPWVCTLTPKAASSAQNSSSRRSRRRTSNESRGSAVASSDPAPVRPDRA